MSVIYSGKVDLDVLFNAIVSQGNLVKGPLVGQLLYKVGLSPGVADDQINCAYADSKTGIGATTTVYDLIGSLQSLDGSTTLNFDEVIFVAYRNRGTLATQYFVFGPDTVQGFGVLAANVGFWQAALGAGGGSIVPAGGDNWVAHYCRGGVPAAAGATDKLSVVTTGTGNAWDCLILGRENP